MAISKQKKQELLSEFTDMANNASTLVFVTFKGLSVNKTIGLRKKLYSENTGYKVTKKTLLRRALEAKGITGEFPVIESELAVAYSNDALVPAKLVYEFGKEHKGKMSIVGGVYGGKFLSASEMTELATIPSREVLLSKIAFLLQSPMQRLAIAVSEVAKTK